MYILSAAAKNIRRHAGRYLLFGALLFVALTVGTVSLSADRVLSAHLTDLLNRYGATVYVGRESSSLPPEALTEIAALPEVKEITMDFFYFGVWPESILVDGEPIDLEAVGKNRAALQRYGERFCNILLRELRPAIALCGISFDEASTDRFRLVEGRLPNAPGELLLRDDFAQLFLFPEVGIGSRIRFSIGLCEQEFTVVGIYNGDGWVPDEYARAMYNNGDECRYFPFLASLADVCAFAADGNVEIYYNDHLKSGAFLLPLDDIWYNTRVILHDLADYSAFTEKVETMGTVEYAGIARPEYTIKYFYREAEALLEHYTQTLRLVNTARNAVLILASTVVLIMAALSMHERRYEIGVLLSVGMPKPRIAALFAAENLIFTVGVTALAFAAGAALAPTAAARLLDGVITIAPADVLSVALPMLALAVCLSLAASSISAVAILRYRPMTILRSRS